MQVDGVLVWVNPIEGGQDRSVLDSMLRDVAAAGVFVSTHPDVILKLGTKEVLYRTRNLGWDCDTHLYGSMDQMVQELPFRLAAGKARVLKQHRGNGGNGVWKVQLPVDALANGEGCSPAALPQPETIVCVRHAKRGCSEEQITLGEFYRRCEPYFSADGRMIDQEYQERLPEGMTRVAILGDPTKALGSSAEVSSAAHLPERIAARVAGGKHGSDAATLLRVEGFGPSVVYRIEALKQLLGKAGPLEEIAGEASKAIWRDIRDCQPFADGGARPVWRVSMAPSQAHHMVMALRMQAALSVLEGTQRIYSSTDGGLTWQTSITVPPGDGMC